MTELLAHQAAAVVKQALMACHTCCRAAIAAVVGQVGPEQLGAVRCQLICMRLQILAMCSSPAQVRAVFETNKHWSCTVDCPDAAEVTI